MTVMILSQTRSEKENHTRISSPLALSVIVAAKVRNDKPPGEGRATGACSADFVFFFLTGITFFRAEDLVFRV